MKISIITVTHNCISTIERTIKSVISQNNEYFEYIVIDGNSEDGTKEAIEKYRDYIQYYVSEPDNGIYFAMNKGIDAAQGDYLFFLNGDDRLIDGAIDTVISYMEYSDADVFYGDVLVGKNAKYRLERIFPLECMHWTMPVCHQSVFVRKEKCHFETNYRIAADYHLLNKLYNESCKFQYIPCVVACFEEGGESSDWHRTGIEIIDIACRAELKYHNANYIQKEILIEKYLDIVNRNIYFAGSNKKELLEFVNQTIQNKARVFIWGTGKITRALWELLMSSDLNIIGAIDNDYDKKNSMFNGVPVLMPDQIIKEKDCSLLVITERYCDEIMAQINEMSLDKTVEVHDFLNMNKKYIDKNRSELVCKGIEMNPLFEEFYRSI